MLGAGRAVLCRCMATDAWRRRRAARRVVPRRRVAPQQGWLRIVDGVGQAVAGSWRPVEPGRLLGNGLIASRASVPPPIRRAWRLRGPGEVNVTRTTPTDGSRGAP